MKPAAFPPAFLEANKVDTLYLVSNEQLSDPLLTKITGITKLNYGFRFVQDAHKNLLMSGPLEARTVRKQYEGKMVGVRSSKEILSHLRPFFRGKRVGLNYSYLTALQQQSLKSLFPKTKFVDVSAALYQSREIKTKEELKKIQEAIAVSVEVEKKIPHFVRTNMTEIDLAAAIKNEFAKSGCDEAFTTLVCFGDNARDIHHFVSTKKLKKGETIMIDYGAKYEGYCSDLTRTWNFGKASEAKHELYATVRAAQEAAAQSIAPGVSADVPHLAAEKVLGKKLPHGLGHGLGLETHDSPRVLSPYSKWKIREGMVLTVEPGSYKEISGMRIEDDVLVTKSGMKRLSTAPKKLHEI